MVYYINHTEIERKKTFLAWLSEAAKEADLEGAQPYTVQALAQERILHLAIESVTDVGNLLIDGFMMRDPSSYEDIVEILKTEEVLDTATADDLIELVRYRKLLLQEYADWDRTSQHPMISRLPGLLTAFAKQAVDYVKANQL